LKDQTSDYFAAFCTFNYSGLGLHSSRFDWFSSKLFTNHHPAHSLFSNIPVPICYTAYGFYYCLLCTK